MAVTKAAIYLRVSTLGQEVENQRRDLLAEMQRRGWTAHKVEYCDVGISGAKGRDKRPGLDQMLKDAAKHRFDVVMVWRLDRLGRSLVDLLHFADDLRTASVDLYIHGSPVDTTTSAGRAFYQMIGVFAELERSMIQDRVKAGKERALAAGKKFGRRTLEQSRADWPKLHAGILRLSAEGVGVGTICKQLAVSSSVVQRVRKAAQPVSHDG